MTDTLQHRLLAHLEQLAQTRHCQWDRLGLMTVQAYIHEQLAALGELEDHRFREGSETGSNLILRLPSLDEPKGGFLSFTARLATEAHRQHRQGMTIDLHTTYVTVCEASQPLHTRYASGLYAYARRT